MCILVVFKYDFEQVKRYSVVQFLLRGFCFFIKVFTASKKYLEPDMYKCKFEVIVNWLQWS